MSDQKEAIQIKSVVQAILTVLYSHLLARPATMRNIHSHLFTVVNFNCGAAEHFARYHRGINVNHRCAVV